MPEIEFFELSRPVHTGRGVRDTVAHLAHDDGMVFVVADGFGEGERATVASRLAVKTTVEAFGQPPQGWSLMQRLRRAVQVANAVLYQKAVTVPELHRMGATLTATGLVGRTLVAAHVGQCRLWLLRNRTLMQLTQDHTWAGETYHPWEDEPRPPRRRYAVPRCLGHELIVSIDLLSLELRTGDVVAQCTDGIHAALAESDIKELLEAHPPEAACRALVRRAHAAGIDADASVQVAAIGALPATARRAWWRLGL